MLNGLWADVFSEDDLKLGTVRDVISVDSSKLLDGVGTFSVSLSGTDSLTFGLVQTNRRLRVYVSQESGDRLVASGVIHGIKITETSGGGTMIADGPDFLDDLTRKSVLLGRSYNNIATEVVTADLVGLASGWTCLTDIGLGNVSARFDGSSSFRALLRLADEIGVHVREGLGDKVLEFGAFGLDTGIRLVNVKSGFSEEAYANEDMIVIDTISEDKTSDDIIDWIIPLGAGTGSASLTLANSTRTTPYPIQTMVGPDGATLYYLSTAVSLGASTQRVVTFKDIGPIANSDAAKIAAANALYDAAASWLSKNNQTLTSYNISCRKSTTNIRPGDKVRMTYRGKIRDIRGRFLKRIDVDDYFWVVKVQEKISSSGSQLSLTINSIDRHNQDTERLLVGMLESIQAQKVGVQTFPCVFQDSSERIIQGSTLPSDPQYKTANFSLRISDIFTDVVRVTLRIITRPLYTVTDVGAVTAVPSALKYDYVVYQGTNYPSDITITIDGIDRTSALGGPWNPAAGNIAVDTEVDITNYIIHSAGGLYQNHTIVFAAGMKVGEGRVSTAHPSSPANNISNGVIECKQLVMGTARAVLPVP